MEAAMSRLVRLPKGVAVKEISIGRRLSTRNAPLQLLARRQGHPKASQCQRRQKRAQSSLVERTRTTFKENPAQGAVGVTILVCCACLVAYTTYWYKIHVLDVYSSFPAPVAKKLRPAIYFTNIKLQPGKAFRFYREALQIAEELGMDPCSDEVLGIKIQLAHMLEEAGFIDRAVQTLAAAKAGSIEWISKQGQAQTKESGGDAEQWRRRSRVLHRTVAMSIKLGDLYELIDRSTEAEEAYSWAVTAIIKEERRRQSLRMGPDETGDWLQSEQIGAALEDFGRYYLNKNKSYLATTLFIRALTYLPTQSCHAVTIMNNIAAALTLQTPPSQVKGSQPAMKTAQIESARAWAQKALALNEAIPRADRTAECDEGCAVATINLGDLARLDGRMDEAKRLWQKGSALSSAAGMEEGVLRANESLQQVK